MQDQNLDVQLNVYDRRKYLFLRQIETLDGFLKNGAISRAQYDLSYTGLVTKMNISDDELADWLQEYKRRAKNED
jgi:hypothetical protein